MCRSTVLYFITLPRQIVLMVILLKVGSSIEETNNPLGADSAKALLMFLFDFILLFQTSVALSYHRANNLTRERECPLSIFLVPQSGQV